jgi:hypothetical protein
LNRLKWLVARLSHTPFMRLCFLQNSDVTYISLSSFTKRLVHANRDHSALARKTVMQTP